jgi:hypothetical protein
MIPFEASKCSVHLLSSGSVICDAEVVLVSGSDEKILQVLDGINSTGILGNFSLVPDSLTISDIPGNGKISS